MLPVLTFRYAEGPYLYILSNAPLQKGALILVDELISAVVILEESEPLNYVLRIYSSQTISSQPKLRVKEWWALQPFDTQIKVSPKFFGKDSDQQAVLEQPCTTSYSHIPGYLGWQLEYQEAEDTERFALASGNDLFHPLVCRFQTTGQWKPGTYFLSVALFTPELLRQTEGFATWTVKTPLKRLGYNQPLLLV